MNSIRRRRRGTGSGNIKWVVAAVSLATLVAAYREAAAEITIGERDGWALSVDGRVNGFVNYTQGDPAPEGVAEWTAGVFEPAEPNSGKIAVVRVRSGFVQNVLGFSVVKEVAPNYKLRGSLRPMGRRIERTQARARPATDGRGARGLPEARGPLGGDTGGARSSGLFGRGGILMDAEESSMPTASAVRARPGSSSAERAASPDMAFCFPVSTRACSIAPRAWPESSSRRVRSTLRQRPRTVRYHALSAHRGAALRQREQHLQCSARRCGYGLLTTALFTVIDPTTMIETPVLGPNGRPLNRVADASGVSAGASLSLGPLQVGGAYYYGTGLPLIVPIFDSPIFAGEDLILRKSQGFVGMASLRFWNTKIAGGGGVSQLRMTPTEMEPFSRVVPPKQQLGISIGVYQTFFKNLTWAIEYFRGQYTWHQYQQTVDLPIVTPMQTVNFVNTGLTLVF